MSTISIGQYDFPQAPAASPLTTECNSDVAVSLQSNYKNTILILCDWFAPGFKAGGPITSCVNFVRAMCRDFEVRVVTSDRDLDDDSPYPNVLLDRWTEFDCGIPVMYCSPDRLRISSMRRLIAESKADFVYLNSMFSTAFTILPLWMKFRDALDSKVILAPRGMLRQSALRFKRNKKRLFLSLLRTSGIWKRIHFHATDEQEYGDILRVFGPSAKVSLAPNFVHAPMRIGLPTKKESGRLRAISIGRIHPVKNTKFLLQALSNTERPIELDLFGPISDDAYWKQCCRLIDELPTNVHVRYLGTLEPKELRRTVAAYHLFVLPTAGENFGHSIFEALSCGTPVLISDQTPWKRLEEQRAGWDLPLDDQGNFVSVIEKCAEMGQQEYNAWSQGAVSVAIRFAGMTKNHETYMKMFS